MPGNAILQQIDVPIERLLAGFRWQSIDFADALSRRLNRRPCFDCSAGKDYSAGAKKLMGVAPVMASAASSVTGAVSICRVGYCAS